MLAGAYQGQTVMVEVLRKCPTASKAYSKAGKALPSSQAAKIAAAVRLRHPHVVATYAARLQPAEMDTLTANAWLSREWCSGGSLRDACARGKLCMPALSAPLAPVFALLRGIAEGLQAMHGAGLTLQGPIWDCVALQVRPT